MSLALVIDIAIGALFSLMALRAFRSGSVTDYLLGATQCVGLLLLLSDYHDLACYLLLLTAAVYLLSQILTGARLISRLLPLTGAAVIALALLSGQVELSCAPDGDVTPICGV